MSIKSSELFCAFPSSFANGDPLDQACVRGYIIPDLQVFSLKYGICFLYELDLSGNEFGFATQKWYAVVGWIEADTATREAYGFKGYYTTIGYIKAPKKGLKPRGNIVDSLENRKKVVAKYDFLPWQVAHYGKEAYEEAIRQDIPNWYSAVEGVASVNPQYFK